MEFLTREERSRRLLRVPGIPHAPSTPAAPVTYAALAVQRALYRSDTQRRLQREPQWWDHPLGEFITPAIYPALVRSTALRRRETARHLGTLQPDVWNYPTTSRPGDAHRALAEPAVTRETRSRRLLRSPVLVATPQPATPAVYPSLVRMEAIRRRDTRRCLRRPLRVPEQFAQLPIGDTYPSYLAREAHRRHGWRQHLCAAALDSYSLTTSSDNAPFVAAQRPPTLRRASRQGLFLAASEVALARVTAQYPSYSPWGFFRREELERRLQRIGQQPRFEPTPPTPPQPVTAWLQPCANRRHGETRLRAVAELNEYPATPPVPPQPVSAFAERKAHRRHGWRALQEWPELDVYALTPGQAEATFPGWIPPKAHRRDGWRALRAVEPVPADVKLPAGHQPFGAWLAHEVMRRYGWRRIPPHLLLADYGEPMISTEDVPSDQRINVAVRSRLVTVTRRSTIITVN